MLLVHFALTPTECVKEFEGADWALLGLQVVKDTLDAKRDGFVVSIVGWHLVDRATECSDYKESLKERIQIASCPLVHKAIILILSLFLSLAFRSRQCLSTLTVLR